MATLFEVRSKTAPFTRLWVDRNATSFSNAVQNAVNTKTTDTAFTFNSVDFYNQNVSGVDFRLMTSMTSANFELANATAAEFNSVNLTGSDFKNAILNNADFTGANLTNCVFTGAKMQGAIFNGATMTGAKF